MSVVITISRPGASPLSRSEIEQTLAANSSFVRDEHGGWRLAHTANGVELFLNVEDMEAWTDGSSHWLEEPSLQSLRQLAATLEARVLGEEGEDLTNEKQSSAKTVNESIGKPATVVAAILAVVLAPFLIIIAVLRLPWMLWRLTRQK